MELKKIFTYATFYQVYQNGTAISQQNPNKIRIPMVNVRAIKRALKNLFHLWNNDKKKVKVETLLVINCNLKSKEQKVRVIMTWTWIKCNYETNQLLLNKKLYEVIKHEFVNIKVLNDKFMFNNFLSKSIHWQDCWYCDLKCFNFTKK